MRTRIGVLPVMQSLDDGMPTGGIIERREAYARAVAGSLREVAELVVAPAVEDRDGIERAVREFERDDVDGLLVLLLTYGPAMHLSRALAETRLPVCLANVQPVSELTSGRDVDTAKAMVRAARPLEVITEDWQSPSLAAAVCRWAHAAAAVTPRRRAEGRGLRPPDERDGRQSSRHPHPAPKPQPAGRLARPR